MSHGQSAINTDNLVPESTDMLVDFLGNSDKLVDSDKRWKYAEHRNSPESAVPHGGHTQHGGHMDYDYDELDEGVDNYISDNHTHGVFNHTDTVRADAGTDTEQYYTETDKPSFGPSAFDAEQQKPLTKDELMLAKLTMLRKLGELKQCGVKLSQNYGLDSDLKMMEYEHKLHHDIRAKQNSVQWMGHMLVGIIKGGELLNDNFNPFDIKLEGLSTKIGSDMNAYYSVLGEIYEKYNQPGKQMAPEFKLLMMITGAALSMQVNRALPGFMGGIASSVQNDDNIKGELRKKAAQESNQGGNQSNSQSNNQAGQNGGQNGGQDGSNNHNGQGQAPISYNEAQHAQASQQVADLKYIQEKELEYQRSLRQAEQARQRGGFVLSSEQPDSDREPQQEERQFTREEIEAIRKEREAREVRYLENLRQKAKINSNAYRSGSSQARHESFENAQAQDLERQARNLDDILGSLEDGDMRDVNPTYTSRNSRHPERVVTQKAKSSSQRSHKSAKRSEQRSEQRSERRSERQSDNRSTFSSASSVSFNPDLEKIITSTTKKTKKNTDNRNKKRSDYEDIQKDSISFGSSDKKKRQKKQNDIMVKFEQLSDSSNPLKVKRSDTRKSDNVSSKSGSKGSAANDDLDFGTISFGSAKKGVAHTFKTG